MNQIYPDQGLADWLDELLANDLVYHLYTNDVTPSRATVLTDLTEAAWGGYATVTRTSADWPLRGVLGHVAFGQGLPCEFLNSTAGTITAYGYYVTDSGATILKAVARFDSAPVSKAIGESFLVPARVGDFSGLSS